MTLASGVSVGSWRRSPEGGEKQLSLAITAQKNKSAGDDIHQTARKLPKHIWTSNGFSASFCPCQSHILGWAIVLPSVVSQFKPDSRPSESSLAGGACAEQPLSPDLPHSHQASGCTVALHCVIHHSCHNPICANITNKARVVYLTQNHSVVSWGRGQWLWDL